jgi:DNA-directed RNA polymerase specialized sigma subunit
MVKKKKANYIDNKKFEEVIANYQQDPAEHETEMIEMFDLLITSIIHSFRFKVDHDDAKQECFLLILKNVNKFDSSKGKAFNYFTTTILNHLKLQYTKNKRYVTKLYEYRDLMGENANKNPQDSD